MENRSNNISLNLNDGLYQESRNRLFNYSHKIYADYKIEMNDCGEECITAIGGVLGIKGYTFPAGDPDLINAFRSTLHQDGTLNKDALISFVKKYGLFGYCRVLEVDSPYESGDINTDKRIKIQKERKLYLDSDPIWWIKEHIKNINTCIELRKLIDECTMTYSNPNKQKVVMKQLQELIKPTQPWDDAKQSISPDGPEQKFLIGTIFRNPGYMAEYRPNRAIEHAHDIIKSIMDNLYYLKWTVDIQSGRIESGFLPISLMDIIFYQVTQELTGNRIRRCAYDRCGKIFIQMDKKEKYCPSETPGKESKCSMKARQDRHRNSQTDEMDINKPRKRGRPLKLKGNSQMGLNNPNHMKEE